MLGLSQPDRGHGRGVRASTWPTTPSACGAGSATCPSTTACPSTRRRPTWWPPSASSAGLPARAARQRASEVLDLVGLDEARFRPVGGFSTGMRQRTKLAQALVADPELVLLDEPTAGLDPTGREEMLALVARLGGFGISVLLATHLLDDVAQVCDHVVMLDGGRLVVAGPTELAAASGPARVTVDVAADAVRRPGRRPGRAGAWPRRRSTNGTRRGDGATGDDDLDAIRDAVADLGLPLHRLTTRRRRSTRCSSRRARAASRVTRRRSTGAVYDRGYRPYDGPRGGRRAAGRALFRASLRRALGLRRPWRQKVPALRRCSPSPPSPPSSTSASATSPATRPPRTSSSSPTGSTSASRARCCCSWPSPPPTSCAPTAASGCCR